MNLLLAVLLAVSATGTESVAPTTDPVQSFAESLQLVGKPSADAYVALSQDGFRCRLVSGIRTYIPTDEPFMYCIKAGSSSPKCDGQLEVIVRFDWGTEKPNPATAPSKNSGSVLASCAP